MRRSGIRLRKATEIDDPAMSGIAAPCLPEVIRVCPKLKRVSAGVGPVVDAVAVSVS
jgi:hypothetical protein